MSKTLFFAVVLVAITGTYGFPPMFPMYDPITTILDELSLMEFELPEIGRELLDKYNRSHCLNDERGDFCETNMAVFFYHHDVHNCNYLMYTGCIDNETRKITARECDGKCMLPPPTAVTAATHDTTQASDAEMTTDMYSTDSNTPSVPVTETSVGTTTV